ncbi:MAG: L-threonylcarbamoyladenylate synthase [Aquificae bacterium]|nr:L-threonylcarbamoyladenylate synthase [Aquificota bacterium]
MFVVPATAERIPLGVKFLKKGFPVVLPTDTLYGICADALDYRAVERVFELKHRTPTKPVIVLIPRLSWLKEFFFLKEVPEAAKKLFLLDVPVSVLLKVEGFEWISRGSGKIAFRLVKGGFVREFLEAYGRPIVAPSANWEGFPPAKDAVHALFYFGNGVAVYYDGGRLEGPPSAVVEVSPEGKLKVLREGVLKGRLPLSEVGG